MHPLTYIHQTAIVATSSSLWQAGSTKIKQEQSVPLPITLPELVCYEWIKFQQSSSCTNVVTKYCTLQLHLLHPVCVNFQQLFHGISELWFNMGHNKVHASKRRWRPYQTYKAPDSDLNIDASRSQYHAYWLLQKTDKLKIIRKFFFQHAITYFCMHL